MFIPWEASPTRDADASLPGTNCEKNENAAAAAGVEFAQQTASLPTSWNEARERLETLVAAVEKQFNLAEEASAASFALRPPTASPSMPTTCVESSRVLSTLNEDKRTLVLDLCQQPIIPPLVQTGLENLTKLVFNPQRLHRIEGAQDANDDTSSTRSSQQQQFALSRDVVSAVEKIVASASSKGGIFKRISPSPADPHFDELSRLFSHIVTLESAALTHSNGNPSSQPTANDALAGAAPSTKDIPTLRAMQVDLEQHLRESESSPKPLFSQDTASLEHLTYLMSVVERLMMSYLTEIQLLASDVTTLRGNRVVHKRCSTVLDEVIRPIQNRLQEQFLFVVKSIDAQDQQLTQDRVQSEQRAKQRQTESSECKSKLLRNHETFVRTLDEVGVLMGKLASIGDERSKLLATATENRHKYEQWVKDNQTRRVEATNSLLYLKTAKQVLNSTTELVIRLNAFMVKAKMAYRPQEDLPDTVTAAMKQTEARATDLRTKFRVLKERHDALASATVSLLQPHQPTASGNSALPAIGEARSNGPRPRIFVGAESMLSDIEQRKQQRQNVVSQFDDAACAILGAV